VQEIKEGGTYFWELTACSDINAETCSFFSQLWGVIPTGSIAVPQPKTPAPGSVVNRSHELTWTRDRYAHTVVLRVTAPGGQQADFFREREGPLPVETVWDSMPLALDTTYQWKLANCTGKDISLCEDEAGTIQWGPEQSFKTTGAAPKNLIISPQQAGKTAIPLTLDWNDVPGAASYSYEVNANPVLTKVVKKSQDRVDHPHIKANTTYAVQIKACADAKGKVCGNPLHGTFTTVALTPPTITSPQPGAEESISSLPLAWGEVFGSNFYHYKLTYIDADASETTACKGRVGESITGIVEGRSAVESVQCAGTYQIQTKACSDVACKDAGAPSSSTSFTVVEDPLSGGLVPCGRAQRNNATPWDERDPCEFKHFFLLIRNLIDFALWKLTLLIAIIFAGLTGALLYFSLGDANTLAQVKSIWKAMGMGALVLIFAWLILNIVLGVLGFNVGIFGNWYEIPT